MRLWSLHPKYLDGKGLVALWREALLAKAVLKNRTRGYKHHPQLERFRKSGKPVGAINLYLKTVLEEAGRRGYSFDSSKVGRGRENTIPVTKGQVDSEWRHLSRKLEVRDPQKLKENKADKGSSLPSVHPLFNVSPGEIEAWERAIEPPP